MGLAWQQGPLAVGHFLVEQPLPERLLSAEPLRRRMRVQFGGEWVAASSALTRGWPACTKGSGWSS
ncbi:hypothetical protein [Amycolatopsis sp. DG1A-15b]|uniref:hypothetical protein n=1 Tax=Amycolatopsis sp. DG1A-15b TaxID=3052846 RepID=UPI00255C1CD2|nr:hypothetical protein [Amycolatopsis sp. DG1A-15b]WIX92044.1 hypothetical protein QRY02_17000 [Amycolatopsis sp. DG1A-15b]